MWQRQERIPMQPLSTFVTPDWVKDAVFYQIFPDRFAFSPAVPKPSNLEPWDSQPTIHGFKGGDLVGVVERLAYLRELGITAIYFCPVFKSTANHRYHTYDYFEVDPLLGGNAALRTLIDSAHALGMKVILDGVFNHSSRGFFQFSHLLENGPSSPYVDWFSVYSWPLHPYDATGEAPGYACWWNLPDLPEFNTNTPAVREFLWEIGEYWLRQGVDGWRLDVPNEIDDDEFWRVFRRRMKAINPEAYIVGEIWGDARRWLQGDQFDAVMNYLFTRACLGFFAGHGAGLDTAAFENTGLWPVELLDASGFGAAIDTILGLYPWESTTSQLNLLDSHDTPRFLTIARQDESSLRLSTLFQMTFPGAPCVYYGDEIGMTGGHDPDSRRSFIWDQGTWNHSLRAYFQRCIALRHAHPVLRHGDYTAIYGMEGVYIFRRRLGDDLAVVALNAGGEGRTVDVVVDEHEPAGRLRSVWREKSPFVSGSRVIGWELPARSGDVLIARREE
jgi:neopullulanase